MIRLCESFYAQTGLFFLTSLAKVIMCSVGRPVCSFLSVPFIAAKQGVKMVSPFEVSVTLPIPREVLWRVRSTRTFMRFLVSNGALRRMDATPIKCEDDRTCTCVQTYVPAKISIPDVVRTVFDDSYLEVRDFQSWSENVPYVQGFDIRPGVLADIVTSSGKLVLGVAEPREGEKVGVEQCVHSLVGSCAVAVPMLGYFVEQAIIANMNDFYDEYVGHIDAFVQMLVQEFGDGSRDSLNSAVDNMLAHEKDLG